MTDPLQKIVRAFAASHTYLRVPENACMRCVPVSENFVKAVPGAVLLHLRGSNRHFYRRADEYPPRDPSFYHCVVRVGPVAVDWTRRALDPTCSFPHVQSLHSLRREWLRVGQQVGGRSQWLEDLDL